MREILILVEGQTEETFARDILRPHLLARELILTPVVVATKWVKAGGKFRGGVTSYRQVQGDVRRLLNHRGAAAITTMLDFYGLPDDFPGWADLPRQGSCYERVRHLEEAFGADIGHRLFLPYFSLHEFESLLLVGPEEIASAFPGQPALGDLGAEIASFSSPEEVNDGPETHPAARIHRAARGYQKTLHGPTIAARIGLPRIRERCPHFAAWLQRLEGLSAP